jgi:hypothetical protein
VYWPIAWVQQMAPEATAIDSKHSQHPSFLHSFNMLQWTSIPTASWSLAEQTKRSRFGRYALQLPCEQSRRLPPIICRVTAAVPQPCTSLLT